MSKPGDIPQDVWDAACAIKILPEFKFAAWRQVLNTDIARAILAAKSEERQDCINVVLGFVQYSEQRGGTAMYPYADATDIARAIRKRGEASNG